MESKTEVRWATFRMIDQFAQDHPANLDIYVWVDELAKIIRRLQLHQEFDPDNPVEVQRFSEAAMALAGLTFSYLQRAALMGWEADQHG